VDTKVQAAGPLLFAAPARPVEGTGTDATSSPTATRDALVDRQSPPTTEWPPTARFSPRMTFICFARVAFASGVPRAFAYRPTRWIAAAETLTWRSKWCS